MEAEGSERPDSPKKKLKAASSTHSDVILPDCSDSNSEASEPHDAVANGLANTRKYRSSVTSSEADLDNDCRSESTTEASSIQEEVVSSSENVVTTVEEDLNTNEAAADSASKESETEIISSNGPERKA